MKTIKKYLEILKQIEQERNFIDNFRKQRNVKLYLIEFQFCSNKCKRCFSSLK